MTDPQFAVAYMKLATIAADEHHTLQEFRASVGSWARSLAGQLMLTVAP